MAKRSHDRARRALRTGLLSLGLLALITWPTHADEASGTWTGELEGRGNYYLERSTRVMIPAARVSLEAPIGLRMNVNYLVDVIASASIAAGPMGDNVFTELRHGIGGGVGKTFEVGEDTLDVSTYVVYSTENDYESWLYGGNFSYAWNQKNSTASLGFSRVSDDIYSTMNRAFHGELEGYTVSLGFSQVLTPVLTGALGYQFVFLEGYLGNPYRKPLIGPLPYEETPPAERFRHNVEGQLSWFIPETSTTVQAYARYYRDDWSIDAITPELRVFQSLGPDLVLRLRFRYYAQTRAFFALPVGQDRYPELYDGPLTRDPKLSNFNSQQLGFRLSMSLRLFGGTFLDFLSRGVVDVAFDRQWCSSLFGNNITGTLGGRLPF
ncbi:MAG: DUF3570 domain-containing protein [Polyangiales bacterium]